MRILGFSFSKIMAEKSKEFKKGAIATNMEFVNVEKEKVEVLKTEEVIKLDFKFSVFYKESNDKNAKTLAEITFQGSMLISTDTSESKQLLDSWKKKQIPDNMKLPLLNIILKKCSVKALVLEEELNLPSHVPLPKLNVKK